MEYAKAALTRDWVRIFMFSGLRGVAINRKYLAILRKRILEPIAVELRHELGIEVRVLQDSLSDQTEVRVGSEGCEWVGTSRHATTD